MGDKIILTRPVFERLLEHLVYIEESMHEIADFYCPDSPEEKEALIDFFNQYIVKIDSVMESLEIVSHLGGKLKQDVCLESLNAFPFAIIGSTIMVEDARGKTDIFKLSHPFDDSDKPENIPSLSFLGKSVLLKEIGHEFLVEMPEGTKRYKIKAVKLL